MNRRSVLAADDLGEQHLDIGLGHGEPLLDVVIGYCSLIPSSNEKKWASAHFRNGPAAEGRLIESFDTRIAPECPDCSAPRAP